MAVSRGSLGSSSGGGASTVTANQGTAAAAASAWPTKIIDSAGTNTAAVSAAGALKVDNSANTQPVSGTVTGNQGTPGSVANSWNVKITDGTSVASIISNAYIGNVQSVANGFVLPAPTIAGASSNISGATVDAGAAKSNWTGFAVPTGTLVGTLTLQLSHDGGNWFDSSVTGTIVAAANLALYSTGRAARYARINLSGVSGSGTVTVSMMAAS